MTREEPIDIIKRMDNGNPTQIRLEALKTVYVALEKQIPNPPYLEGDGYDENGEMIYDTWECPSCSESYEVDYEKHDYCPNCGQAIDWREQE